MKAAAASKNSRRDAVFGALSDPTRRALLERLRERERPVSELQEPFQISQPAISQHLRVLTDAGLVSARRQGREKYYRVQAGPLHDAFDWLGRYQKVWTEKPGAAGALLDEAKR